uniref:ParA family protein n=1 Tax=Amycolatopsis sp. CA-096443 TaxID=3239919 RepID=UPI003F49747F
MNPTASVVPRELLPGGRRNPLILAFLLQAGGTAKTTSTIMLGTILALRGYNVRIFDLDAQCNASHILCQSRAELDEDQPTIWDLVKGEVSLAEATVPARMWNGEEPKDWDSERKGPWVEYPEIPNLYLVPGDDEMKNCDTYMTQEPDTFMWFWELISRYKAGDLEAGENEVWLLDLPANLGRGTVSVLIGMDDGDEVVPPVLVTGKEEDALNKIIKTELPYVVQKYAHRAWPARPRINHILMCATPTSTHTSVEYRETVKAIEKEYDDKLLPYIRFSSVLAGQFRRRCPVRITDPNQRPTKDYEAVADRLGFPDLEVG